MIKKNIKKIVIGVALVLLLLPFIRTNYNVEGKGILQKETSVIGILIQDMKDGTVGTGFKVIK